MRLLALDLGAKMGWAVWDGTAVTSGVEFLTRSKSSRFEGPGMRFIRLRRWLDSEPTPTQVAFESVRRHRGVDAAHAYGGYLATLTAYCDAQSPQVPYEAYTPGEIKKLATGRGNASKDEMMQAAKYAGYEPLTDDEADALWILALLMLKEGLEFPLRKRES